MSDIAGLIERLEKASGPDNALDLAVEVALFRPDRRHVAVRPNAAGTKLVYTRPDGGANTYRAFDWTLGGTSKALAIGKLRALLSQEKANAD
jgi:hypothetical protein